MKHVLLALALGFASSSLAQGNPASSSPLSSVFSNIVGQVKQGQTPPTAPSTAASDKTLTYKPSAKVSADVRKVFIDGLVALGKQNGTLTAANEQQLRAEFAKIDIAAEFQKALGPKGYDVNNVATALTLYVVSSFEILDDMQTSEAQDRAAFEQFRGALKALPAMAAMSDADKQKFAEALMWMAAFQANDAELARTGAPGYTLAAVKAQVRSGLKSFNVDPALVRIGDKGLQARK